MGPGSGPSAAEGEGVEEAAAELVGGAADVDGDDDAAVCASLFKVGQRGLWAGQGEALQRGEGRAR